MRCFGWSFAVILLGAAWIAAQPPNLTPAGQRPPNQPPAASMPAPPSNPANSRLDSLLVEWEKSMKGVETLMAAVKLTEIDDIAKSSEEYEGHIKFMRPNFADLAVANKRNPQNYKRYLCTGTYLYDFAPKEKRIRAYPLQQRAAGQAVVDNTFIGFLAGISAAETSRRFNLTFVTSPQNPTGEDQYYYYLKVEPRLPEDKAEFSVARIAILKANMMPAEMRFVPPTGGEVRWTITSIQTNAASRVSRTDFAAPQKPAGWEMQQMPAPGPPAANVPGRPPPSKVRPNGQ